MKVLKFTVWPLLIDVLSMIRSVPVVPTTPCSWQLVPAGRRPCRRRAIPAATATADLAPSMSLTPADAAAGAGTTSTRRVLPARVAESWLGLS